MESTKRASLSAISTMAVTESEVAGAFSKIGEDPSDKVFIGKCERQAHGRGSLEPWHVGWRSCPTFQLSC